MTKMVTFLLMFVSVSCFSANFGISQYINTEPEKCEKINSVTDPDFCPHFTSIAKCHCSADGGLPKDFCQSPKMTMSAIYKRMIATFGSQANACKWQAEHGAQERATFQECMDDWDCYNKGGNHGGLCSGTGAKCP